MTACLDASLTRRWTSSTDREDAGTRRCADAYMGWGRDEGAPTSPPVHVQLKPHKRAALQSKFATMSIET